MKIFEKYNPKQIARYVKTFFLGYLYIKGIGFFEFDKGRLKFPRKHRNHQQLSVLSEVNRQISQLR
ncbi:MAG: DUF1107 family protein [Candidatus Symbiodolus clandestinus]